MIEPVMFKVYLRMISGRIYNLELTDMNIDWIFDSMMGRSDKDFQNFDDMVINVKQIEYMKYTEIEGK